MKKQRKEKGDANASPDSSNSRIGVLNSAPNNIITKTKEVVNVVFVIADEGLFPIRFEELKDANELLHRLEDAFETKLPTFKLEFPSGVSTLIPLAKISYVYTEFIAE